MFNPPVERVPVFTFATPNQDILFWEMVNFDLQRNKNLKYGDEHWDKKRYPNHRIVNIQSADDSGFKYKVWYYLPLENQDKYNFEFTEANIGGTKFDAVKRTYLFLREDWTEGDISMGTAMPMIPVDKFTGNYVLAQREQAQPDKVLEGLFVVEVRLFVKKQTIRKIGVDTMNGNPLVSDSTLYYYGEEVTGGKRVEELFANPTNAFWGLGNDGFMNSGTQLSAKWYLIEREQVVSVDQNGRIIAYTTNENYYWPPVLQFIELMDWDKREGGQMIVPRIVMKREAFRGPCLTLVSIYWSRGEHNGVGVIDQLQPNGGSYSCPFFDLHIPECLHGFISVQCDIGTNDPIWGQNTGSRRSFSATNETDWPPSVIAEDSQQPYKGGFLRTIKEVFAPTGGGGGSPVTPVAKPTDLAVSGKTDVSFILSWTGDPLLPYLVEVAKDEDFTDFVFYDNVPTNTREITGLTPSTTYYCRVTTIRPDCVSEPSDSLEVTTDPP